MAEDAIAKARAIAARLGAVAGGGGSVGSELGKRKNRWDDDASAGGGHHGLGALTKQKVYVPVREYPDYNWIGLLIGPRGKTQKELEQRTGAKILFRGRGSSKDGLPTGHPDDDDELHVHVEGPSDSVEKAVAELESIFKNPAKADELKQQQLRNLADINSGGGGQQSSIYGPGSGGGSSGSTGPVGEIRFDGGEHVVDLEVPNNLVGFIIGRGGENIVKMQTQTGGHIQIAKESEMRPGETMRRVTIRGSEGAVRELKSRVEETVTMKTGGGRSMSAPKEQRELDTAFVLKVVIPNDKVGLIIGKGGATVKMIQDKTDSNVQIPPQPDEDNPNVRTLSIGAETREAVEACQLEIFNTLQQQQQQLMSGGASAYQPPAAFTMLIPDDRVGVVIGKRGATISDMQNRYGVRIQIPTYADPGSYPPVRTVSITGGNGQELLVKAEIEALVNNSAPGSAYGQPQGSYYGGGADYYAQQSQSYYGQAYAAQAAAAQAPAAETDPTAYYPDFWNYASLYGEEAARAYYTTWSPPVGTAPPAGITLPSATAAPAAAAGEGSTEQAAATEQTPEAIAAAWELYNKQYAEWMAQQAAAGGEVPTEAAAAPAAEEGAPPPPEA